MREIIIPFYRARCIRRTAPRYRTCASACSIRIRWCCRSRRKRSRRSTRRWRTTARSGSPRPTSPTAQRRLRALGRGALPPPGPSRCACPRPARIDDDGPRRRWPAAFEREYERLFGRGRGAQGRRHRARQLRRRRDRRRAEQSRRRARATGGRNEPRARPHDVLPDRSATWSTTPVYDGPALSRRRRASPGPAIIEHPGTTIVVLARPDGAHRRLPPHAHRSPRHAGAAAHEPAHPDAVDPVTFEVLNHRLLSDHRGDGHPVHALLGLQRADHRQRCRHRRHAAGRLARLGRPLHRDAGQRAAADRREHAAAHRPGRSAIDDGDIFICNDPYLGAIHHPDFATVAPMFSRGRARRVDRRLGPSARHRRHGPGRLLDQGGRHAPGGPAHAAGEAASTRAWCARTCCAGS